MFVEFTLGSDVLSSALSRVSGVRLWVEGVDITESTSLRAVFWAEGAVAELDAFETAMEDDPTVCDPTLLVDTGSRRLYRFQYPEDTPDVDLYQTAVEMDSVALDITNDGDGWVVASVFPDSDSFNALRAHCEELGVDISINTIYSDDAHDSPESALTPRQHETLLTALESGYFSIPRETSLAELAECLDVSPQAVSERLRRGTATLVRESLAESPPPALSE